MPETEERYRFELVAQTLPAFLQADQDLLKKADDDCYRIGFVFADQPTAGKYVQFHRVAERLRQSPKNLALCPFVIDVASLDTIGITEKVAAFFVAERLGRELPAVIATARRLKALSISPFPEDVDQGICASMAVTSTVIPYLNRTCLDKSNILLRPFFLGVSTFSSDSTPKPAPRLSEAKPD